eukprot:gene11866-biopygen9452
MHPALGARMARPPRIHCRFPPLRPELHARWSQRCSLLRRPDLVLRLVEVTPAHAPRMVHYLEVGRVRGPPRLRSAPHRSVVMVWRCFNEIDSFVPPCLLSLPEVRIRTGTTVWVARVGGAPLPARGGASVGRPRRGGVQ